MSRDKIQNIDSSIENEDLPVSVDSDDDLVSEEGNLSDLLEEDLILETFEVFNDEVKLKPSDYEEDSVEMAVDLLEGIRLPRIKGFSVRHLEDYTSTAPVALAPPQPSSANNDNYAISIPGFPKIYDPGLSGLLGPFFTSATEASPLGYFKGKPKIFSFNLDHATFESYRKMHLRDIVSHLLSGIPDSERVIGYYDKKFFISNIALQLMEGETFTYGLGQTGFLFFENQKTVFRAGKLHNTQKKTLVCWGNSSYLSLREHFSERINLLFNKVVIITRSYEENRLLMKGTVNQTVENTVDVFGRSIISLNTADSFTEHFIFTDTSRLPEEISSKFLSTTLSHPDTGYNMQAYSFTPVAPVRIFEGGFNRFLKSTKYVVGESPSEVKPGDAAWKIRVNLMTKEEMVTLLNHNSVVFVAVDQTKLLPTPPVQFKLSFSEKNILLRYEYGYTSNIVHALEFNDGEAQKAFQTLFEDFRESTGQSFLVLEGHVYGTELIVWDVTSPLPKYVSNPFRTYEPLFTFFSHMKFWIRSPNKPVVQPSHNKLNDIKNECLFTIRFVNWVPMEMHELRAKRGDSLLFKHYSLDAADRRIDFHVIPDEIRVNFGLFFDKEGVLCLRHLRPEKGSGDTNANLPFKNHLLVIPLCRNIGILDFENNTQGRMQKILEHPEIVAIECEKYSLTSDVFEYTCPLDEFQRVKTMYNIHSLNELLIRSTIVNQKVDKRKRTSKLLLVVDPPGTFHDWHANFDQKGGVVRGTFKKHNQGIIKFPLLVKISKQTFVTMTSIKDKLRDKDIEEKMSRYFPLTKKFFDEERFRSGFGGSKAIPWMPDVEIDAFLDLYQHSLIQDIEELPVILKRTRAQDFISKMVSYCRTRSFDPFVIQQGHMQEIFSHILSLKDISERDPRSGVQETLNLGEIMACVKPFEYLSYVFPIGSYLQEKRYTHNEIQSFIQHFKYCLAPDGYRAGLAMFSVSTKTRNGGPKINSSFASRYTVFYSKSIVAPEINSLHIGLKFPSETPIPNDVFEFTTNNPEQRERKFFYPQNKEACVLRTGNRGKRRKIKIGRAHV